MKIAVLLGGTSAERDVSIKTGFAIACALQENGHEVQAIDCAYGSKKLDFEQPFIIDNHHSEIEKEKAALNRNIFRTVEYLTEEKFDIAFIALHGGYGENGKVQALLELIGIPYTGSDSLASAVGMDKHLSKLIFQSQQIATAPWFACEKGNTFSNEAFEELGFPLVVKPNAQGSTVGLSIVHSMQEIAAAFELAFQFDEKILVEKFVPGREITVTLLGNKALPIVEIIPKSGFYDYESKYQSGKTQYITPAELPEKLTADVQRSALNAYHALGCSGYARADYRLQEDGQFFCLEVNTLPGMTPTSLVPKAAKAKGIRFNNLVEKIIELGME